MYPTLDKANASIFARARSYICFVTLQPKQGPQTNKTKIVIDDLHSVGDKDFITCNIKGKRTPILQFFHRDLK